MKLSNCLLQEELGKNLKVNTESKKKVERELSQIKVENQWLVTNKKNRGGSEERVEDLARELLDLKRELKEEKEKVKLTF